ncbi:Protein EXORDIUM-like protein [Dioscorea alata]|uniref:Protein EXORDIUM-like protein n=1 Tax=Dioscorea alata TaxID=55571 RepID=A0ACB7W6Y7_DIOAL|nr:Protein EXORDIUM-like protein [Dioscorea alata]
MTTSFHVITKTTTFLLLLLLFLSSFSVCFGTRTLNSLYKPPPNLLKYHNGPLLEGNIPISILWYGNFKPSQKSILIDFILSLTPLHHPHTSNRAPTVSHWWKTVDDLLTMVGKTKTHIFISEQTTDLHYSLGKHLNKSQIERLTTKRAKTTKEGIMLVLTSEDVAVEGFCMSHCGYHSSHSGEKEAYIWVGNSVSQCPGQCAWPFHQPLYGPQMATPLVSPNGDVGVDGMVINLATLMAGTVTDPFGRGYFQGEEGGEVEVVAACSGVFGKGAFSGYTGEVLVDKTGNGGSYNVVGLTGRKFLVPAMLDPSTSSCSPMV